MIKIIPSAELTNETYHSDAYPQASGSILAIIHADCPAVLKYGEEKESKPMALGVAGHVLLLEPERFDAKFIRGLDVADYPEALVTGKDLEGWCRDGGIKGYSGKKKDDLIAWILANKSPSEQVLIWDLKTLEFETEAQLKGVTVLPFETYDTVKKMRDAIFLNGYGELLKDGKTELSIIDEDSNLKCRFDFASVAGRPIIVDYKTTTSSHPELFGRQAHNMHYWLKMAIQKELYIKAFGVEPEVVLLAQSTKKPYIPQAYFLSDEQLEIGREHYQMAHKIYEQCVKTNVWQAYGGGIQELQTPPYLAKQYGFDVEGGIAFID